MKKYTLKTFLILAILLGLGVLAYKSQDGGLPIKAASSRPVPEGVWVTVFSKQKVMYSKTAALALVTFCKDHGLKDIYLQVYRAGKPFYDSALFQKDDYLKRAVEMGSDPVDYIIEEAHKNNIRVHAWVNVLSLAQNKNAEILKRFGPSVLTKDRNQRTSIRTEGANDSDQYYLRDDQLFLEPGDERVTQFTLDVVGDLVARYPSFDGLHLDYIRYPYPIPYIPDSRFLEFGVSYGFGEHNVDRFRKAVGANPLRDNMYQNDLHLKWDQWKRNQVTALVSEISRRVRQSRPEWRISVAALPGVERSYSVVSADWLLWLERNLVDHIILMNYTRDSRLFYQTTKAALNSKFQDKVYVGLGTFMFKTLQEFNLHHSIARDLQPAGIVHFSYDEYLAWKKKSEAR